MTDGLLDLPAPLACQIVARATSWDQESYATVQRNIGVGLALDAIREHQPRLALLVLLGSVERQARILGLGHVRLEVPA